MMKLRSKVILVANQKGGVGKTTVSTFLAESLSIHKHKKVLIVDLDMQCNTSDYFVGMEPTTDDIAGMLPPKHPDFDSEQDAESNNCNWRSSIADIFFGKMVLPYSTFLEEDSSNPSCGFVDILLGHPKYLEEVNEKHSNGTSEFQTKIIDRLNNFLHDIQVRDAYDVIILDTGPSRTGIFHAALRAATHVLMPYKPESYSVQGLNAMMQAISNELFMRPNNIPELINIGFLANLVENNKMHSEYKEQVENDLVKCAFPKDLFIPRRTIIAQRSIPGATPKSIFHMSDKQSEEIRNQLKSVFSHVAIKAGIQ